MNNLAPDAADPKALLHARLRRDRLTLWEKAAGLPEWQQRMPLTPTGTSLLGLIKHVAFVEAGYFGSCLGRPFTDGPGYLVNGDEELADDDDLWAFPEESPAFILDLAARVGAHADATIEALPATAVGHVHWWGPQGRDVTLLELLVHMLDELARHLGHADILRELSDGEAGLRRGNSNLPAHRTQQEWEERRLRLLAVAEATRTEPEH